MLYTIAQAARAMGLEESVILKAIEEGVITPTKNISGELHVDDVELHLLYLYLAKNYCKHQWQIDPQRGRGKHPEPEIAPIAERDEEATVEQEQSAMQTLADVREVSPTMPAPESTCQDEIRIDDRDRICAAGPRRAFQGRRAASFAAIVFLALGCVGALSSWYSSGRIRTEQAASPLTPLRHAEEATIAAATVEASSREQMVSNVVGASSKAQERSSPPPITQRASTTPHAAAEKEQSKESRNRAPVPETRPTTIPGWTVTSVNNGIATLQGPEGTLKVARGDTVPILGKIDSVVLWGNRWIVATSKGLITTP